MEAGMCNSEFRTPHSHCRSGSKFKVQSEKFQPRRAHGGIRTTRSPSPWPSASGRGNTVRHFGWLSIALLLVPHLGYATSPKLASITPTGAQRGMEVELKLAGS